MPNRPAQLSAAFSKNSKVVKPHSNLLSRRLARVGSQYLFYSDPITIVRGEGAWLFDNNKRRYLDCYNNVASVGHCHPKVVKALTSQAATLNTHTRYLHPTLVEYAELLVEKMPGALNVCHFVCTGTEANDLAVRMARAYTEHQGLVVLENSYHGCSTLVDELSTTLNPSPPAYVHSVEPPNIYRGTHRGDDAGQHYAALVTDACETLNKQGHGVAAFLCDTAFDTQGTLDAPIDYFSRVQKAVHQRGGLFIADEVQAGLCRTGAFWGFQNYDLVPDIVTLGKPMGNGHPIAVVITTQAISEKFAEKALYFNTFGGNPVSAAVGKAVLEVVYNEKILEHTQRVGAYLKSELHELAKRHPVIGDIRGRGLFYGVELVTNGDTLEPADKIAREIPDRMRAHGVLLGLSGRFGNVIKIRPPLVITEKQCDLLIAALDQTLHELSGEET